jgi:hypothetical protein
MVSSNIGLDDFGPETGGDTIRVGETLARGVPIRWDEAVALLQEVVDLVSSGGREDAPIPAFDDILIDREGAVTVHGTRRGERGPVAAGRALHTLLATADVPVALRLFVTQANAPETHASLKAFADGLAYFGRPGRADLIRAIYERHRASAGATAPASARPAAPATPKKAAPSDQTAEQRHTAARWLMPAAAVVCVVGLAAVIWLGFGQGSGEASSVVARAKAAIATVTPAIKSALAPATNSTPAAATESKPEKPSHSAPPRPRPGSGNRAPTRDLETSGAGSAGRSLFVAPPVEPPFPLSGPVQDLAAASAESVAAVTATEHVVAPRENAKAIYSEDDPDVQPPVMLYPALPPPVFFAINAETVVLNRMELVIAADGSVERVRLVNGPTRMPDMMLLSGAKLWRFTPAVKDGVPVRYRTTVTWSGFP